MKNLLALFMLLFTSSLIAQQYITDPINGFSRKKTAYITMQDGTTKEGTIHNAKTKKGLYERITMKINGKKVKIDATKIASMYIPQSGFDKFADAMDMTSDIKRINNYGEDVNEEYMKEGYAYFETTKCQIRKKKEGVVLLQLLNPSCSNKIKIYFDPYAAETMSLGVAGMTVAGGIAKSYFVKKGDKKAYRLKKKDYKDEFGRLYTKCGKFKKSVDKIKWNDFGEHVYNYSKMCNE